jgi:hypothetical protein
MNAVHLAHLGWFVQCLDVYSDTIFEIGVFGVVAVEVGDALLILASLLPGPDE